MTCQIRSGVCWTVATTQVYRYGGKFWACDKCVEAIQAQEIVKAKDNADKLLFYRGGGGMDDSPADEVP
jgi:ribosomal protein L37AE/L43A